MSLQEQKTPPNEKACLELSRLEGKLSGIYLGLCLTKKDEEIHCGFHAFKDLIEHVNSIKEILIKTDDVPYKEDHKTENSSSPEQFNVGWVYQDGRGEWFLITHIWDDDRTYPIKASSPILVKKDLSEFTSLGKYYNDSENDVLDLILSTGKPHEQWNNGTINND